MKVKVISSEFREWYKHLTKEEERKVLSIAKPMAASAIHRPKIVPEHSNLQQWLRNRNTDVKKALLHNNLTAGIIYLDSHPTEGTPEFKCTGGVIQLLTAEHGARYFGGNSSKCLMHTSPVFIDKRGIEIRPGTGTKKCRRNFGSCI